MKQLVSVLEHRWSTTEEGSKHPSAELPLCHASLVVAEEGDCWVRLERAKFLFMPYRIGISFTNCKAAFYLLCYAQGILNFLIHTALEEYY